MIKILNTISGQKEDLVPRKNKKIQMFVCGPTVYDLSHLGHARTFIFFDSVAKYLRYAGYKVKYVMNITDMDDRIIDRAGQENKTVKEVATIYEKLFLEDMNSLRVNGVDEFARATDYIPQIIKQVRTLIKKGNAYKIDGDGYYFDLSTFSDYGKLAGRTMLQAEDSVSRIDDGVGKRNRGDFALWKFPKEGEPAWDFDTGKYLGTATTAPAFAKATAGKPGGHIEDNAITEHFFGSQYDIHGGAVDLIFPHHEAEIAQQESASGRKPFVKYWLHTGFLTINGRKMSKSLGNFTTIRDLLKRYSPEAIRLMSLSAYYRTPLDYNDNVIEQSEAGVKRIYEFVYKLGLAKGKGKESVEEKVKQARQKFSEAMNDDFNTPQAVAVVFDMVRDLNDSLTRNSLDKKSIKGIGVFLKEVDSVLGIISSRREKIPDEVQKLAEKREKFRKEKNWGEADKTRTQIGDLGYEVSDTVYGPLLKRK